MQPEASHSEPNFGDIRLMVDNWATAAKTPTNFNPLNTESDIYTFDMLQWKTGECLTGKIFHLKWPENGEKAEVKFLEIDYFYPENSESFWDTIQNNKNIATYQTIGGDFNPFVSKNIEQDGQFWHSKNATGDRGVEIRFKNKVCVESFKFQTRQDSGKFVKSIL